MRMLVALFAALALTSTTAQDSSAVSGKPSILIVKLAPLFLLNGYFDQSVRLSVERDLGRRISAQLEYGWYPKGFNLNDVSGHWASVQLRHMMINGPTDRWGIGLGVAYKEQRFDTADSTWTAPFSGQYYKPYTLEKRVLVVSIQAFRAVTIRRILIEGAAGFGARYKEVDCQGMTEEELKNRDFGDSMVLGTTKECFTGVKPSVEINIRIGYRMR